MPFAKGTVTAAEEAEEEDVIDLCDLQPVDPEGSASQAISRSTPTTSCRPAAS